MDPVMGTPGAGCGLRCEASGQLAGLAGHPSLNWGSAARFLATRDPSAWLIPTTGTPMRILGLRMEARSPFLEQRPDNRARGTKASTGVRRWPSPDLGMHAEPRSVQPCTHAHVTSSTSVG